jgi:hypothetical protein
VVLAGVERGADGFQFVVSPAESLARGFLDGMAAASQRFIQSGGLN